MIIVIAANCRITVIPNEESGKPAEVRVAAAGDSSDVLEYLTPDELRASSFVYCNGVIAKDSAGALQRLVAASKDLPEEEEAPPEEMKRCPKCHSKLRVVDGPRGRFVGCTSFPKCRFSANEINDWRITGAEPPRPEARR